MFSCVLQPSYEILLRKPPFRTSQTKSQNGWPLCFWQRTPTRQHRRLFSKRMLALRNSSSSAKKCISIIRTALDAQNSPRVCLRKSWKQLEQQEIGIPFSNCRNSSSPEFSQQKLSIIGRLVFLAQTPAKQVGMAQQAIRNSAA